MPSASIRYGRWLLRCTISESRSLERQVLAPIFAACVRFQAEGVLRREVPVEVVMAMVWGAFVGLIKAERLGYLSADEAALAHARDACWRAFAAP